MYAEPAVDNPVWFLLAASLLGLWLGVGLVVGTFVVRTVRGYLRREEGEE